MKLCTTFTPIPVSETVQWVCTIMQTAYVLCASRLVWHVQQDSAASHVSVTFICSTLQIVSLSVLTAMSNKSPTAFYVTHNAEHVKAPLQTVHLALRILSCTKILVSGTVPQECTIDKMESAPIASRLVSLAEPDSIVHHAWLIFIFSMELVVSLSVPTDTSSKSTLV